MFNAAIRDTPQRTGSIRSSGLGRPGRRVPRIAAVSVCAASLTIGLTACGGGSAAPQANGVADRATNGSPSTTTPSGTTSPKAAGTAPAPKALVVGNHSTNLDFAVPADGDATSPGSNPFSSTTTPPETFAASHTPVEAATVLLRALIAGDADAAWKRLGRSEQDRLGYKQRLVEEVSGAGWKTFTVKEVRGNNVTVEVVQTPRISDIDGVIASKASLTLPTVNDTQGYSVVWSRRRIEQLYPERTDRSDREIESTVLAWARSRQDCTAGSHEYAGGLLGVVGLSTALCHTTAAPTVRGIGDLDSLDEPQPVIDSFGGSALLWARVVSLDGPVPMNVIVAPEGESWSIVGIARASLSTP
jgi:hypothetical protein